jgi:hypothetical protein
MVDGQVEGDDRAVAPADHVGLGDPEMVKQTDGVGGHLVVGDRLVAPGRAAVAVAIHGHDPVAGGGEHGGLVAEVLGVAQAAVNEQHGLPSWVAVELVVELGPIDGRRLSRVPGGRVIGRRGRGRGGALGGGAEATDGGEAGDDAGNAGDKDGATTHGGFLRERAGRSIATEGRSIPIAGRSGWPAIGRFVDIACHVAQTTLCATSPHRARLFRN